jgi:Fe-S cluster assembly ATP-binding protein
MSVLIITHNTRIAQLVKPDFVHLLVKGRIVRSTTSAVLPSLEQKGFGALV